MRKLCILYVDDEINQCKIIKMIVEKSGYTVETVQNGPDALRMMDTRHFDIVITDLMLGEMNGMELLEKIKLKDEGCKVLILTGYGSISNAVEAIKKGAESYLIKSHGPDELIAELHRIEKTIRLENSSEIMDEQQRSYKYMLESKNAGYRKVLSIIEKAASSKANILILGESGVGKEVLAQHVHQMSKSGQNFLAVSCHALPANIIESELFGHEKGAFTGATTRHKGRFEAVDGGTLFLDEIGDIPLPIQAILLRTLESRTIERIGNNKSINVDFRLVSATNAKIHQAIEAGTFREDLFYRLSAITVEIPPLRSRMEDLPSLIELFFEKFSREMKKPVEPPPQKILSVLMNHRFPGNIRELKNIIERLVVLSHDGKISADDLPDNFARFTEGSSSTSPAKDGLTLRMARVNAEREQILRALSKTDHNVAQAAALLDVSVRQLFYKIKEYGITTRQ